MNTPEIKCYHCRWFKDASRDKSFGHCQYHPPTVVIYAGNPSSELPYVQANGKCFSFQIGAEIERERE